VNSLPQPENRPADLTERTNAAGEPSESPADYGKNGPAVVTRYRMFSSVKGQAARRARVRAAFTAASCRPAAPFVRTAFFAAARRFALPRRRALLRA